MENEEEIGCPPVADKSNPKPVPKISTVKVDGTVVEGDGATAGAGTPPAAEEAAAASSAPRRRGRPRGSGAGATKPRNKPAPAPEPTPSVGHSIKTHLRFVAMGPDGSRTRFDRVVTAHGDDATITSAKFAERLGKAYKSWEKLLLG